MTSFINKEEQRTGNPDFDYSGLSDDKAEFGREDTVKEKGFFILSSQLFQNVLKNAKNDPDLNETLSAVFTGIENSAKGAFTSDKLLLAMRPYQIVATERILNRIQVSSNYKTFGTIRGGGYIWHTTGSGKTLTSFKTAQLASKLPYIDKVLFVVDRKDLDYQTMREYDKFERGAANSNTNTSILKRQLEDPGARIIITTIQKLSILIRKNKSHPSFCKHMVIIFDECHRSQFGDMHSAIVKSFKKYHVGKDYFVFQ